MNYSNNKKGRFGRMELLNVLGAYIEENIESFVIIAFTICYCLENKRYLNKRKGEMNEAN